MKQKSKNHLKEKIMKTKLFIAALSTALVSGSAQAAPISYDINETWSDGATFSGSFIYDSTTQVLSSFTGTLSDAITSRSDIFWSQYVNDWSNLSFQAPVYTSDEIQVTLLNNGNNAWVNLSLSLSDISQQANSANNYYYDTADSSIFLHSANPTHFAVTPTPSAVPLPPSVAMFATGLLGLGLARRKTNTPALAV